MIDWPSSENTFIHILSIMEENITLRRKEVNLKRFSYCGGRIYVKDMNGTHLGKGECSAASSSRSAVARSAGWTVATQPL